MFRTATLTTPATRLPSAWPSACPCLRACLIGDKQPRGFERELDYATLQRQTAFEPLAR